MLSINGLPVPPTVSAGGGTTAAPAGVMSSTKSDPGALRMARCFTFAIYFVT